MRMCQTADARRRLKPYAAMRAIAPRMSRRRGPTVLARRPENGESTIITRPEGMITRLAASRVSPNPVGAGSSSSCG
jgi:hypothetical protein